MNNQRRHELERNILATYLGAFLSKTQHLLKPLALAVLVAGVGLAGYNIYQSLSAQRSSSAWAEYYFNLEGDATSFQELSKSLGSGSAGQWARYTAAVGFLRDGIDALYVNRQEGVADIQKAIEELEKLKGSSIQELALQSLLALAKAHESLGQLPEAVAYYRQLADHPGITDIERQQIAERLEFLSSDEAQKFYEWFASLNPKPSPPPPLPSDLTVPPTVPTIEFDPSNLPDIPHAEPPPNVEIPEPELPPSNTPAPSPPEPDDIKPSQPEPPVVPPRESPSETPVPN